MYIFSKWLPGLLIIMLISTGCHKTLLKEPNLEPNDKRPIYRITVGDADEAQLLQQQLKLDILRIEGPNLFFFESTGTLLDSLKNLGYFAENVVSQQVFYRIVKIPGLDKEDNLSETGVQLINREKDHLIVRGNLNQLKLLKERGVSITVPGYEARPRQIQISISNRSDVQRVSEFYIDIYSVENTKEDGLVIYGGAFDYQIDLLKENDFQVTVMPSIKSGGGR